MHLVFYPLTERLRAYFVMYLYFSTRSSTVSRNELQERLIGLHAWWLIGLEAHKVVKVKSRK